MYRDPARWPLLDPRAIAARTGDFHELRADRAVDTLEQLRLRVDDVAGAIARENVALYAAHEHALERAAQRASRDPNTASDTLMHRLPSTRTSNQEHSCK
jgi:hypothetical protein